VYPVFFSKNLLSYVVGHIYLISQKVPNNSTTTSIVWVMDRVFNEAYKSLQVIVSTATEGTVTTIQQASVQSVDALQGNNIASTTTKTINAVGHSIDTICEAIGLQRRTD